ncbi:MAG: alpha-L-fucosidase [Oscillospiraceae bacterium]|nr:alpha-L-fucosidase [Oscillospiraceae bacterium]
MGKQPYEIAAEVRPTERQMLWQETEFNALICFGMNTFTGVDWGDGFAVPGSFWPEDFSAGEWAEHVKAAGMSGLILTCKHHDGFCLWPTEYTDYSVKSAKNWMNGEGDIVRDVSAACRKYGLKFGIYLSPWDVHEPSYGTGEPYNEFFRGQLHELLTNYGDVFCVWLDGVYGEGVNGKTQEFDFESYYALIRELQPHAAIAACGPDVRWCGNERGVLRREEWSVVPKYLVAGSGAKKPEKKAKAVTDLDLGSRKAIKNEAEFIWYPCEVNVSMRPRWFFHKDDNYSVKSKDKLWKLYCNTVGANSNLLLGIAPDKRGRLYEIDSQVLHAFGKYLDMIFAYDLAAEKGSVSASSQLSELYAPGNVLNEKQDSFWRPAAGDKKPEIIIELEEEDLFDKLVIREHIRNGQHVEEFEVFCENGKGKWKSVYQSNVIGSKRICPLKPTKVKRVKIVFLKFRSFIEISKVSLY